MELKKNCDRDEESVLNKNIVVIYLTSFLLDVRRVADERECLETVQCLTYAAHQAVLQILILNEDTT